MNRSRLAMLTMAFTLASCATSHNPQDPLEGYNRAMFAFNDKADQFVMKPVATVYHTVLPSFVQTGVSNFFGNLGDVWTSVNDMLEGKFRNGMSDIGRVGINTAFGIGGLFDVGSAVGLAKRNRDFGETLGGWGVKPGPYVVLPLLGSTTLRDTVALPVDYAGDPWSYVYPVRLRNSGELLRFIDQRAKLLDASTLLDQAALDRYEFVRDAYLQRRENKVRDEDQFNSKQGDTSKPAAPSKEPGKETPAPPPPSNDTKQ